MDTTRHCLLYPLAMASKVELLRYWQEPLVPTCFVYVARDAGASITRPLYWRLYVLKL